MTDELAEMRARAEKAEARWLDAERADTEKAHRIAVLEGELFAARLANETLTAERDALQRHFDAAAPEHNLPALLDLYFERQVKAEKERDEARELLMLVLLGDGYEPYLIDRIEAHLGERQPASNPSADDGVGIVTPRRTLVGWRVRWEEQVRGFWHPAETRLYCVCARASRRAAREYARSKPLSVGWPETIRNVRLMRVYRRSK